VGEKGKTWLEKTSALDSSLVRMEFSPELREQFRALAAATYFSDHVNEPINTTIQEWAAGKNPSVGDFIWWLPKLCKEVADHTHATGDKQAADILSNIRDLLSTKDISHDGEEHYKLQNYRQRTRGPASPGGDGGRQA